jgi:hypothetical protein
MVERHHPVCMIAAIAVALGGNAWAAAAAIPSTITLRGIIKCPAHTHVVAIEAVDRNRANVLKVSRNLSTPWVLKGHFHQHTDHFSIPLVPTGHTYDLILLTRHGRWEGVNMRYERPILPGPPATPGDIRQIVNFIEKIPRFTNYNRPLWIAATHNFATVVVEQLRTDAFYSGGKGSVIFRVAVWYFQRYHAAWSKVSNMGKVMTRWRGKPATMPNPWQYLPQLGGIRVHSGGRYRAINVTLPPPSPHHGLDGPLPH